MKELVAGQQETARAERLDVADGVQIGQAVRRAEEKLRRIDVPGEQCGMRLSRGPEEGEDDQMRAMFETNFFGLVSELCCNRLVSATKYAVEGLSESLSIKLCPARY